MRAGEQSDGSSAAMLGRWGLEAGEERLSQDPAGAAALTPTPTPTPPCTLQVEEALAVLQAHQATEHMQGVNLC